jgi:hypothetical protein
MPPSTDRGHGPGRSPWRPRFPKGPTAAGCTTTILASPASKAYSFGSVTAMLFLLSWAGQFIAQIVHERNEARQHGESFMWADFWPQFLASTLESGSPSSCRWCGRRSVLRCCFCGLVAVHGGRRADRGQARPVARGTRCRSRRGDPYGQRVVVTPFGPGPGRHQPNMGVGRTAAVVTSDLWSPPLPGAPSACRIGASPARPGAYPVGGHTWWAAHTSSGRRSSGGRRRDGRPPWQARRERS